MTLVDYTETAQAVPETHAHSYDALSFDVSEVDAQSFDAPAAAMPPPAEMPPVESLEAAHPAMPLGSETALPELGDEPGLNDEAEFAPMHASSWLSSDFSAGIPAVAPFVIDAPAPEAPPAAAPQLIVRIGRLSATFAVAKDVTTIGRPDSALHYYPDIEIEMDDAVSRRHAEIVKRPDGYYLVDTGSTNGTSLNGEMLLPHQEQHLAHGDTIRVGDRTEISFE